MCTYQISINSDKTLKGCYCRLALYGREYCMYLQVWKKLSPSHIMEIWAQATRGWWSSSSWVHGFIHGMSHQPITAVKKFLLMVWGSWKNPTLGSIKNLAQPHMLQFLNNCKWCPIHTGEKPRACKNVIKNSYKSGNCLYKNTPFINKAWIIILRICISPCFIL